MKILLLISFFLTNLAFAKESNFSISILEINKNPKLRLLFTGKGQSWKAIDPTKKVNIKSWSIYKNASYVGNVQTTSKTNGENESDQNVYNVKDSSKQKYFSKAEVDDFANWMNIPAYRPMLAMSVKQKSNPFYKNTEITKATKDRVIAKFRKMYPKATQCDPDSDDSNDKKFDYKDESVIFIKEIKITSFGSLVGLKLDSTLNECDAQPENEWTTHWFLVTKSDIKLLGKEIFPVDGVQYNKDQLWLFSLNSYNTDGYILFFDNFKKSVTTTWNYH